MNRSATSVRILIAALQRRIAQAALLGTLASAILPAMAIAAGITGSKHDLSAAGPGKVTASSETEICIFCHAPHNSAGDAPRWNRYSPGTTYTPYNSSTVKAPIGQPTGSSKLCLSCHDGTVALGMVRNRATPIAMSGGVVRMPAGPSNLGTDLSDDHPISFTYDATLAAHSGELRDPAALPSAVRIGKDGQLQCTACHDAHNNQYGSFLVMNNARSALCTTCHVKTYWITTDHSTSTKTWNGQLPDPWPHTEATTVAANGCENCHAPHTAGTGPRLLNFAKEEDNCYPCHNGNAAAKNIQREFAKSSVHPVARSAGIHDPMEDAVNPPRHVECEDCHNPHAAMSAATPTAPAASGPLAGVRGIDATGKVVTQLDNEYELCFRCHADSRDRGAARVRRQFPETNTRLEFAPANSSYHPVEANGKNAEVPSLLSGYRASSRISCTDCHNNDQGPRAGGGGPDGPHGSTYVPLLERRLLLTDLSRHSTANFALCYKCHNSASILSDASFPDHNKHVVDEKTACTTCHDPHGVPSVPHLINFNLDYVSANSEGKLEYIATGTLQGTCSLRCHDVDHKDQSYGNMQLRRMRRGH